MDTDKKTHRFIIDNIDKRLGSVDAELKFDKIMIGVGLLIVIVFSFLLGLTIKSHPVLSLVFTLFIFFWPLPFLFYDKGVFCRLKKEIVVRC